MLISGLMGGAYGSLATIYWMPVLVERFGWKPITTYSIQADDGQKVIVSVGAIMGISIFAIMMQIIMGKKRIIN